MGLSCSPPVEFVVQNLPVRLLGAGPEDGSSGVEAGGCLYFNERGRLRCRRRLQRLRPGPLTAGTAQLRAGLQLHLVPSGTQTTSKAIKNAAHTNINRAGDLADFYISTGLWNF